MLLLCSSAGSCVSAANILRARMERNGATGGEDVEKKGQIEGKSGGGAPFPRGDPWKGKGWMGTGLLRRKGARPNKTPHHPFRPPALCPNTSHLPPAFLGLGTQLLPTLKPQTWPSRWKAAGRQDQTRIGAEEGVGGGVLDPGGGGV